MYGLRGAPARCLLLLVLTLLAVAPGITTLPVLDRDESRFVQATKQMVESGDYIDIRFQEEKRYKKPIGVYWLQAAAVNLFGDGANSPIWVYRLVSVLAAALAVLAVAWTGTRLFGPDAGFISGLVFAGIFAVAFEGRIAKTDAALLAFTTLAQGSLAQIYVAARSDRPAAARLRRIFWIAEGCAILVKGPIAPLAALLTMASLYAFDRDRRWWRELKPASGLIVAGAIVFPWLILISWKSGGAFWQESVGKDMLGKVTGGQESHGFPPGFYALTYSLYLWPFGPLAIGAGLCAWNSARADPRLAFLIAWYLPFWLFFELIPTKLPNYVIPAYPALALLVGWALTLSAEATREPLRAWQTWLLRLTAFGHAAVSIGLAAAAIGLPWYLEGAVTPAGIVAALCVLGAGFLALPRGVQLPARRIGLAAAAGALAYGLLFGVVLPGLSTIWLSPRIAAAVEAARACPETVLASIRFHEPSLVFLAGTGTVMTDVDGAARHLLADPACGLALVPEAASGTLLDIVAASGRRAERAGRVDGVNYSNGDRLSLSLWRISR